MVTIPMTHRTAEPIPDQVLSAWLQDALAFVEALFGPRDTAWAVGPARVVPNGPHIHLPAGTHHAVEVHLGPYAQHFAPTAFFQLAHETVHLLNPRVGAVSLLEDGLAVWASLAFVHARTPGHDMRASLGPRFAEALAAVEAVLGPPEGADPTQAGAPVRALRARAGALSNVTADDLRAVWPGLDRVAAAYLAAPAEMTRPAGVFPVAAPGMGALGSVRAAAGEPLLTTPLPNALPVAPTAPPAVPFSDEWLRYWVLEALAYVEARFGPRDPRYLFRDPYTGGEGPICYTPTAGLPYVHICLSEGSRRNQWCAMFESAHEAVHALTPRLGEGRASLFEEGLATWASVAYMWHSSLQNVRSWLSPRYAEALALVEPLLGEANPGLPTPRTIEEIRAIDSAGQGHPRREREASVLALRDRVGAISDATADDLQAVWPALDRATAERLAAPAGEMRPDFPAAVAPSLSSPAGVASASSSRCGCAVCGAEVPFIRTVHIATPPGTANHVDCPTCGSFEFTTDVLSWVLAPERQALRPYLSAGLRAAAERGAVPMLTAETYSALVDAGVQVGRASPPNAS